MNKPPQWCWPEGDSHFHQYGEWWQYQKKSRREFVRAMRDLNNWQEAPLLSRDHIDTVIDIGAHVGTWSLDLCRDSQRVYAYEPLYWRELALNQQFTGEKNLVIRPHVISNRPGEVVVGRRRDNSGDSGIGLEDGREQIRMRAQRLDLFEHEGWIQGIKIDVQGHELAVLQGAAKTIQEHHPIVLAEFNEGNAMAAVLLESWGYELRTRVGKDWIWQPREIL